MRWSISAAPYKVAHNKPPSFSSPFPGTRSCWARATPTWHQHPTFLPPSRPCVNPHLTHAGTRSCWARATPTWHQHPTLLPPSPRVNPHLTHAGTRSCWARATPTWPPPSRAWWPTRRRCAPSSSRRQQQGRRERGWVCLRCVLGCVAGGVVASVAGSEGLRACCCGRVEQSGSKGASARVVTHRARER